MSENYSEKIYEINRWWFWFFENLNSYDKYLGKK